jgi:CBS domain-containing protein
VYRGAAARRAKILSSQLQGTPVFTARQIMTTDVVSVPPSMSIEKLVAVLEENGVSGLPVVDDAGRLVGVVTEYDLLRRICAKQLRGTVAEFMQSDVITISPEAMLDEIVELFLSKRIRRVFVCDEGQLLGVVSRRDLVVVGHVRQGIMDFVDDMAAQTTDAVSA